MNHKHDFRPKLHDPKFNYHFIRSILKKALKSDWLFCFTVPFSFAEKKMPFRAKDNANRE